MTRVLVVQQYLPPGAPQDQQRGPMYAPLFQAAGIDVRYVGRHPIPAKRLSRMRSRFARWLRESLIYRAWYRALDAVVTAVHDRRILRIARGFDVILLIKVNSISLIRELRRVTRARLVFDLADVWRPHAAKTFGSIDEIIATVDAITVDNSLALAYARRHNSSVHIWPSASYVESFDLHRAASRRGRDGRVVLGWVGSPTTVSNLYLILESLEDVFRTHGDLHLRLVGVPEEHELLRRFEHVRASCRLAYDADDMVREVLDMDIGLFPAYDLEDSALHGTTKAVIYMGGGAVVVSSPVGDCPRVVRDSENGMVAAGRADWTGKLDALIRDSALRARLSEAGLRTARAEYSLQTCFAQLRGAIGV